MTDAGDLSPCICHLQTPHPHREISQKVMDDRLFCYKSVLQNRCFGFAVEEGILRRSTDGNGQHLFMLTIPLRDSLVVWESLR